MPILGNPNGLLRVVTVQKCKQVRDKIMPILGNPNGLLCVVTVQKCQQVRRVCPYLVILMDFCAWLQCKNASRLDVYAHTW